VDPRPTPPRLARGLALVSFLFLVWRAGTALALHGEKLSSPFGTQLDALRWSEGRRIQRTIAALERELKSEPGYLSEMYAAVASLPEHSEVWVFAPSKDARRRAIVRLKYLLFPREVRPLEVTPRVGQDQGEPDSYLLTFASHPVDGIGLGLRTVHAGPDWTLWSR
jgi:hypothetical protein